MYFKTLSEIYNSTQARTLLIAGIALIILYYTNLMTSAVLLTSLLITAYIVNCLVKGNCQMIAWLYVVINVMATYNLLK